ncbi:maleylpyruvate isomerase N-terminal domain-containing protein [Nocardioides sp.]|uniref:maleylpyruvate isomerase N-terminal domain-containing protein n=1 Tax=Nocardioides sp. TaxID=35761 RepID=UPI0035645524
MSLETLPATLESTRRLIRTVDALTDEELLADSLLPCWSRGHVVAHLARNAEGIADALNGLAQGEEVPMYASQEARDRDIEELVEQGPAAMRDALMSGCHRFQEAVENLPEACWTGSFPRVPGGQRFEVADIVATRRREVEVHHADLGAQYSPDDWPDDFVVELLDTVVVDHADDGPFVVQATDLDRRWSVGLRPDPDAGDHLQVVSGTGGDLGWWLTGRGQGGGLAADPGGLPKIGPWRRTPAR